jgi:hypothetical protein
MNYVARKRSGYSDLSFPRRHISSAENNQNVLVLYWDYPRYYVPRIKDAVQEKFSDKSRCYMIYEAKKVEHIN